MSQQALDLRRSIQIVRRHKVLVGVVVAAPGYRRWRRLRRAQPADAHEHRAGRAAAIARAQRPASNSQRNRSLYGDPRGDCEQ